MEHLTTRQTIMLLAAYGLQAVFGAIALFGLILAAILWTVPGALAYAVAACGAQVFSLLFQMRAVTGDRTMMAFAWAMWLLVFILAIASLVALIH